MKQRIGEEATKNLNIILCDSLDKIAKELGTTTSFSIIAQAFENFFSLSTNYLKGQGEHFAAWVKKAKPGGIFPHVRGSQGSRRDLIFMAALVFYWNCNANVDCME